MGYVEGRVTRHKERLRFGARACHLAAISALRYAAQSSAQGGCHSATRGGPTLAIFEPSLAQFGPSSVQHRSGSAEHRPELGRVRFNTWAEIGRTRHKLG